MGRNIIGADPLSYLGILEQNPPNIKFTDEPPSKYNFKDFNDGDLWVDKTNEKVYMLIKKGVEEGTWAELTNSGAFAAVTGLTGNTGGVIGPDGLNNINIVGTGGISVAGDPMTNKLTISGSGSSSTVDTLTGDAGGAISPDVLNNINLVGSGTVTITGNPATNTLTFYGSGGGIGYGPSFLAVCTTNTPNVTGESTIVTPYIFPTVRFNNGGGYNATTGVFTAPETGEYLLTANFTFYDLIPANNDLDLSIYASVYSYDIAYCNIALIANAFNQQATVNGSVIVHLDAGQNAGVTLRIRGNTTKNVGVVGSSRTYFCGSRVG